MRQIALPDSLATDIADWIESQDTPPSFAEVVQTSLTEYLARRAGNRPARLLRITPARRGSGFSGGSLRHDEHFT